MATYRIECEPCQIYWEVERSMDKPPKKAKCPQCGKMGERCWTAPNLQFVGPDFHTNKAKAARYERFGMDKDTANQFLNTSIETSKQRMQEGHQHYQKMYLDEDYAAKKGIIKKVDDKRKNEKREVAKKFIEDTHKKAYKK